MLIFKCVCMDVTTVERLQAMFTVLHSFGCVSSHHSEASSRFAMVLSLDFNHKGLAAAGHLQVPHTNSPPPPFFF